MGMYGDKELKVTFSPDAFLLYRNLQEAVKQEKEHGKETSFYQQLLNAIEREKEYLNQNPERGTHIKKKLIPKLYINLYGVNNLWKIDLPSFYRMLYTIDTSGKTVINSIILTIVDHDQYNKIFGYRKK